MPVIFPWPSSRIRRAHSIVLGLVAILLGSTALAQGSGGAAITVDDAVRRAMARPELAAALAGPAAVEAAEARRVSVWPNPVVSYEREQTSRDGRPETEETIAVSQTIEISGRRGLRADAATKRAKAAGLESEASRRRTAVETRHRFWTVVYRQGRHAVIAKWVQRLEAAAGLVAQRKEARESSTYDTLRVAREVRASRVELDLAAVNRETAWLRLMALTGSMEAPSGWPRTAGALTPSKSEAAANSAGKRPDVEAWATRAAAAQLEADAAARGWIPAIDVNGGWRRIDDSGTQSQGYTAGIGLTIPLFDRGQGDGAVARAEVVRAQAMEKLVADDARRQRNSVEIRARQLAALATKFRAETETAARELEATAQAAWQGGELDVLELLDVHRGAREDALVALDLEYAAREAREELRAITLEEVP
jgi:cobalt-zinc-cadmium efflux system outer membrane protein